VNLNVDVVRGNVVIDGEGKTLREWAYARSYDSSDQRADFLPLFLHDYDFHRPYSALRHLPPSSRLPKTADNVWKCNS
jgi:hypothetical protein